MENLDLKGVDVYTHGDHYQIVEEADPLALPCVVFWEDGENIKTDGVHVFSWRGEIDVYCFYMQMSNDHCFYNSKNELWNDIMNRFCSKQLTLDALNDATLGDWDEDIDEDRIIIEHNGDYTIVNRKTNELYYDRRHYKVVYVKKVLKNEDK